MSSRIVARDPGSEYDDGTPSMTEDELAEELSLIPGRAEYVEYWDDDGEMECDGQVCYCGGCP